MTIEQNEWFKNWFDTSYYHLLYKKRDEVEAARFIDLLIDFLRPPKNSGFLDLACGKGRHSIYLNQKGYDVTGLDLSHKSIEFARLSGSATLRFREHDMRQNLPGNSYDYVLNLFTSFGYFTDPADDKAVVKNIKQCLKPGGIFILDYFNAAKPNNHFNSRFSKTVDSVRFDMIKHIKGDLIIKEIKVTDCDKEYEFREQVRIYSLQQFIQILTDEGLTLIKTFGSYELEPYDELKSERLILIAGN